MSRAQRFGFKGAYVGQSVCHHFVDPNRLRFKYMYLFGVQKGIAEMRFNRTVAENVSYFREVEFAVRGLWQLFKGRGDRFRQCVINMGIQAGMRRASKKKLGHFIKTL